MKAGIEMNGSILNKLWSLSAFRREARSPILAPEAATSLSAWKNRLVPEVRVFAVDLDEGLNDYVRQEALVRGLDNVQVITAKPEDPLLPEAGIDLIFSSNTYHHIQNRAQYFSRARRHLRPGGSVAIVDFDNLHWILQLLGHWVARDQILLGMTEAGDHLKREFDFLPRQNFLIFETSD